MAAKITILDGGMGHLLRRRGVAIKGVIGSMQRFLGVALANVDNPDLVRSCHSEYLSAGAEVITTNNYSCVPAAIELAGDGSWSVVGNAIDQAGLRAREAVNFASSSSSQVAGCLPPLHESYQFDRVGPVEELEDAYSQIVRRIAPHSDLLLCETMSSVREAKCAAVAASVAKMPVWVSWTLHEDGSGNLRSSESIGEAVRAVSGVKNLEACLLNCCSHESIVAAIPMVKQALEEVGRSDVKIGAYANGFVTVHADSMMSSDGGGEYRDLSPEQYLSQVNEWISLGCTIVGGCCGVFPEHIQKMAEELQR